MLCGPGQGCRQEGRSAPQYHRLVQTSRRSASAFALLGLLAAGCASSSPASGGDPGVEALRAQQSELSRQALATLATRTCPQLPSSTTLAGLPSTQLRCLGTGPARSVGAGDGRPTVVNLWASWCAPCVREMPLLQRTADRASTAVRFVGIDTEDERDSAASLLAATGVRYEQYDDPDGQVRSATRAVGLPVCSASTGSAATPTPQSRRSRHARACPAGR